MKNYEILQVVKAANRIRGLGHSGLHLRQTKIFERWRVDCKRCSKSVFIIDKYSLHGVYEDRTHPDGIRTSIYIKCKGSQQVVIFRSVMLHLVNCNECIIEDVLRA